MSELNDFSSTAPDFGYRRGDPLADRLRSAAWAERPAFSPDLHRRIASMIRREQASPARARWRDRRTLSAAAAVLLAVLIPLVVWTIQSNRKSPTSTNAIVVKIPQPKEDHPRIAARPSSDSAGAQSDSADLISVRAWPPALVVHLPLPVGIGNFRPARQYRPAPRPAVSLPGSPEWLFAVIESPRGRVLALNGILLSQTQTPAEEKRQTFLR